MDMALHALLEKLNFVITGANVVTRMALRRYLKELQQPEQLPRPGGSIAVRRVVLVKMSSGIHTTKDNSTCCCIQTSTRSFVQTCPDLSRLGGKWHLLGIH